MSTTKPQAAIEAGDTLENLVQQFSEQFAFLRELIQNSMDAGSTRIDISFEYRPAAEPEKGIIILHVDDYGEGMNREIIDTQLTRLFSSSKENDLTKVGKFGIGFVSIFALKPKAVVLDTGRDGEYWRIFFKEDKTFDRIVLDEPVEGTKIQWIGQGTPAYFEEFKTRSWAIITKWCKHSAAEIYVDGVLANQPFTIDDPFLVKAEMPGTEIVLAPTHADKPEFGYYNRGLTLHEGEEALIPGVRFKINSRYLEHTLTRDNVLQDENYEKAMALLRDAVDNKLRPNLFRRAAECQDRAELDRVLGYLSFRLKKLPEVLNSLPILPVHHGDKISLKQLKKAASKAKEVFWDLDESPVTRTLNGQGTPVLNWRGPAEEPGLDKFLRAALDRIDLRQASRAWGQPQVLQNLPPEHKTLLDSAARILNRAGSPYKSLLPATFDYPGSGIADELYLVQQTAGELQRLDGKVRRSLLGFLFGKATGKVLLLNYSHQLIQPHFTLHKKQPALAAYLLAKAVTLDDGVDPLTEARLVEAAMDEEEALVGGNGKKK